jgi:hypothetical protein
MKASPFRHVDDGTGSVGLGGNGLNFGLQEGHGVTPFEALLLLGIESFEPLTGARVHHCSLDLLDAVVKLLGKLQVDLVEIIGPDDAAVSNHVIRYFNGKMTVWTAVLRELICYFLLLLFHAGKFLLFFPA